MQWPTSETMNLWLTEWLTGVNSNYFLEIYELEWLLRDLKQTFTRCSNNLVSFPMNHNVNNNWNGCVWVRRACDQWSTIAWAAPLLVTTISKVTQLTRSPWSGFPLHCCASTMQSDWVQCYAAGLMPGQILQTAMDQSHAEDQISSLPWSVANTWLLMMM